MEIVLSVILVLKRRVLGLKPRIKENFVFETSSDAF